MAAESPKVTGGYQVANALGVLNANRPKLGAACVEAEPRAKVAAWILRIIFMWAEEQGKSLEDIRRAVRRGDIEVRHQGNLITVVTP